MAISGVIDFREDHCSRPRDTPHLDPPFNEGWSDFKVSPSETASGCSAIPPRPPPSQVAHFQSLIDDGVQFDYVGPTWETLKALTSVRGLAEAEVIGPAFATQFLPLFNPAAFSFFPLLSIPRSLPKNHCAH